jgi:hypothetical protein
MKQGLGKVAIATTTFVCMAMLSLTCSEQRGVLLSIESAQAGGYYGAYASGYPRYYGDVYANRSRVTERPTLVHMAGNYGAYCFGLYPYGYYWSCPWVRYYYGGYYYGSGR